MEKKANRDLKDKIASARAKMKKGNDVPPKLLQEINTLHDICVPTSLTTGDFSKMVGPDLLKKLINYWITGKA